MRDSSYFQHIWGNGYAAGYYAYLWTEMLADDGFQWLYRTVSDPIASARQSGLHHPTDARCTLAEKAIPTCKC